MQIHWNIIGTYVKDADRWIWEINGFLLIFYPFAALIDRFQMNKASASTIAPLLFQMFEVYADIEEDWQCYFQSDYWKEGLHFAKTCLWRRTLGGSQRDFILSSYAVSPVGAYMLNAG
jgi:hypothetical protein